MRLDPSDRRPVYRQVADELRRAITSGTYEPGQRLPSGRLLAREYGIAPMTVASALDVLRAEGLIASWQGRGVYVLEAGPVPTASAGGTGADRISALEAEVAGLRRAVTALEQKVARLDAPASAPRPRPAGHSPAR